MKKIVILLFIFVLKIYAYYPFTDPAGYASCPCDTNQPNRGDFPFRWIVTKDIDENKDIIGSGTYNYQLYTCRDQVSRYIIKSKIISDITPVSLVYPKTWAFTTSYQNHTEICSCGIDNTNYPLKEDNYRYFTIYNDNYKNTCTDFYHGSIETRINSCRIQERCKYCIQPSDPTPQPPEDTNTTHWELIGEKSCSDDNTTLPEVCIDTNASDVRIQTWNTGCCGENKRCYVSTPVCDENQTLDMNATPPICRDDNCTEPDETYDYPTDLTSVATKNSCEDSTESDQICSDNNGTWYETARVNCCVYSTCLVDPDACKEEDTDFPEPADNQSPAFTWTKPSRAADCKALYKPEIQERRVNCETEYRCLTGICPKEKEEPISSYVSPHSDSFHEDIPLAGTDYHLHYSSANRDNTTIAHGWSISPHAMLRANKLYYGSGSLYAVEPLSEGNITVVKSGSKELVFDNNGLLLSTRHIYTKEPITTFGYDNMGRLVTVTDIYGQITTLERDSDGRVTAIVAPAGQRSLLSIDSSGDLTEVQYEDTSSYVFEYEEHLMTVEHEPNGNRFLHFFDKFGHVIKVLDAEQGEWLFGANDTDTDNSHTVHRASGDTIVYKNHFVSDGLLKTDKILPSGEVVHYETAIDNSMNSTTSCGMKTTNLYKKNSDGTLYKDAFTQRMVLDTSTVTTPHGLRKVTTHNTSYANNAQRITRTTTTNGKTQTTVRDYTAHTQVTTTAEGKSSTTTYDADNLHVVKTEPFFKVKPYSDHATYYTYDDKGRVTQEKFKNHITKYSYDALGNLHTVTNPLGETTTYSYDALGRVSDIQYADSRTMHYDYDKNGNMTTLITPSTTEHDFAYNGVNKRTNYTSPLQKATSYHYDKQRRVTQIVKPSSKTIDYHYNNGKLDYIERPEGKTTYSYNCQSNPSSITQGSESVAYSYDGTLLTAMVQSGVLEQTIAYSYSNDFLVDTMTYAGASTSYLYNKDNEMVQAGEMQIEKLYRRWATYTQYKTANYTETYSDAFYGNGIRWHYDNKFQYFNYTQENNAGQINWRFDYTRKTGGHSFRYKYDKRGRLTEVKDVGKVVERYSYDANGNRASATVYGKSTTASYTLDDQLEVYGQNTYRYDDDGYLIEKVTPQGTTTYTYGTLGELKEVITPTHTVSYKHNALNQRVAKLVDGQVVEKYLWKDLTTLLAVYDKDDTLVQRFEYTDRRMPLTMTMNSQTYHLHYDQVGTLRVVTNAHGQNIKEITYDTFGHVRKDTNPSFNIPFGFAGGLYDVDTKLTRFGYRDYDAYTGKWTAKDPIGFDGGDSNLYGYVLGDPVSFVDPEGLSILDYLLTIDDMIEKIQKYKKYNEAKGCADKLDVMINYCDDYYPKGAPGRKACNDAITQIYGKCEESGRCRVTY